MPRFDSVIFDLDGTLWDTTELCAQAWGGVLQELGLSPRGLTAAEVAGVMGRPGKKVFEALMPALSEQQRGSVTEKCFAAGTRMEFQPFTLGDGITNGRRPFFPD